MAALHAGGYHAVSTAKTLDDALEQALGKADAQTPVLFSPACASFDMFAHFEARGRAFKAAVQERLALAAAG
jgi:UDP-N-acetylmuramoylalanine--D-glutamate ligase